MDTPEEPEEPEEPEPEEPDDDDDDHSPSAMGMGRKAGKPQVGKSKRTANSLSNLTIFESSGASTVERAGGVGMSETAAIVGSVSFVIVGGIVLIMNRQKLVNVAEVSTSEHIGATVTAV
jgi:hypothetical protein